MIPALFYETLLFREHPLLSNRVCCVTIRLSVKYSHAGQKFIGLNLAIGVSFIYKLLTLTHNPEQMLHFKPSFHLSAETLTSFIQHSSLSSITTD